MHCIIFKHKRVTKRSDILDKFLTVLNPSTIIKFFMGKAQEDNKQGLNYGSFIDRYFHPGISK